MSFKERLLKALKSPVQRTYEQQSQVARSLKYRISIKESGLVTKHKIYPEVPEVLFGDPVNFQFPLSPIERIRDSITEFNHGDVESLYNQSEWRIIGKRIGSAYPGWNYNKRSNLIQPINPLAQQSREGGPGSGHHGHAGRPGKRGGSAPGKGGGGGKAKGGEVQAVLNRYEKDGVFEDRMEYSEEMLGEQEPQLSEQEVSTLYKQLQSGESDMSREYKIARNASELTGARVLPSDAKIKAIRFEGSGEDEYVGKFYPAVGDKEPSVAVLYTPSNNRRGDYLTAGFIGLKVPDEAAAVKTFTKIAKKHKAFKGPGWTKITDATRMSPKRKGRRRKREIQDLYQQIQAVENAFGEKYGSTDTPMETAVVGPSDLYVREVYEDYLIVRDEKDDLYKVSYSAEGEGFSFGERDSWVKVEKAYVEAKEGGAGSGHHGHAGRPGKRGGSAPGKGGGGGGGAGKTLTKDEKVVADLLQTFEDYNVTEDRMEYGELDLKNTYDLTDEQAKMLNDELQTGTFDWKGKYGVAEKEGSVKETGYPSWAQGDDSRTDAFEDALFSKADIRADITDNPEAPLKGYISAFEKEGFTVEEDFDHDPGVNLSYLVTSPDGKREFLFSQDLEEFIAEDAYWEADKIFTSSGYDVLNFGDAETMIKVITPRGTKPKWLKKSGT